MRDPRSTRARRELAAALGVASLATLLLALAVFAPRFRASPRPAETFEFDEPAAATK